MTKGTTSGFTLIELMIVVAVIAIVSALAIPRFVSARISANENAAIATLRTVAAAQQTLQASAAIDTDADGGGEYGYFAELAGAVPVRAYSNTGPVVGTVILDPTLVGAGFGALVADGDGDGVVQRQGYHFKIWLPDGAAFGPVTGVPEVPSGGGGATLPGAARSEIYWVCYAWPVQAGRTGHRAFVINQDGEVLSAANRDGAVYTGTAAGAVPGYDAAYSTAGDMASKLAVEAAGLSATDGRAWTPVGN